MGNESSHERKKHKRPSSEVNEKKETKLGDEAEVEFESKLAEGTTATAYKGLWSGNEVAIKQFREEGEQTEFLRELLILSKVRHANIIHFYSSNATKRFIILEFMVNGTLLNAIQRDHAISWPDRRISIGYDITKGMNYLHGNGIVHCDLRCANCLVASFYPYKVKIFDFSSSKMINDFDINQGIWSGDIHFQPPEVCKRVIERVIRIDYPMKVDLFSFGMTLLELITSKIPFEEYSEEATIARQIMDGIRPKIPEDTPSQYSGIIKRCWEQDPTKRPSFDELLSIFQQLDIHGPQLEIQSQLL